ncbi:hypothetical protein CDO52_12895 [Nocardiopsis gilva YIM 90087]|uniref:Uncharacterized protein n=1 Tax=Nocardiopsis gilva YIM 90087 TaxID=1235441 RepID=A0A223S624_9ACTN|nr:hypothetical protein [Nocardiopsis gilva]ASU83566.1 hypothetical protein CDO52_12895 [Nocardiopsis gilva YIM 90087]
MNLPYWNNRSGIWDDEPATTTCLWETDGGAECGNPIPANADSDEPFCSWHQGAVDRGEITYEEYRALRTHHQPVI